MDHQGEVRAFLASRRARVSPEDAGVISYGVRKVAGLRRSEVAQLAGVSIEYYTRMERGNLRGVSDPVLHGVAVALRLDESERAHLVELARSADPARSRRRPRPAELSTSVQHVLDAMTGVPALVRNGRMDVLAINALGRALYADAFAGDPGGRAVDGPVNLARFCFLDPHARRMYGDWDTYADANVALLRTEAGRDPDDQDLTELVGELSTRSAEFRRRWATHDVRLHHSGRTRFSHPVVGDLDLAFDSFALPGQPGLTLKAYSAEPGSATADGLALLADWYDRRELERPYRSGQAAETPASAAAT